MRTSEILLKKVERIEEMLFELNSKIDNFLGYEELNEDELKEIKKALKEVKNGRYSTFEEVFKE